MEDKIFVIEDEIKKLPLKPGVYLMHGENDEVIYVGKAVRLKNRVKSYFDNSKKNVKTLTMVSHVNRFEYIVTDTEVEALILESNLIKEYRPKYNILLMDDKNYPYIKVTLSEEFPRVVLARRIGKDKNTSKYFGPFISNKDVKDMIELIQKIFGIRKCNKNISKNKVDRACLNYHIGRCKAPCINNINTQEYRANVDKAIDFLKGNYKPVIKMLKNKMLELSEALKYEEAAYYKSLIDSINRLFENQKITDTKYKDRDIVGISVQDGNAVVQVFFVREGKIIGRDNFYLNIPNDESEDKILEEFIKQFYSGTPYIPSEIMLPVELRNCSDIELYLEQLKNEKVKIIVPKLGQKEKLIELANRNASLILEKDKNRLERENNKTIGAVKEISEILKLENIHRIEAYDISNISGVNSIGSMVVYEDGKPSKSEYRKFNIKYVQGPDDYNSLKEVLNRRFSHGMRDLETNVTSSFARFPDLIMMDGGKGQVNIAIKVLDELGVNIPVCGMVKDDNHRTRGLYYNNLELPIDSRSEGFKLITRIQDEAHRFAITSHRLKRGKEQVKSILDDIDGIGPVRRKALRRELESIENIKNASIERLMEIPEISKKQAETIYYFFHNEK